MRADQQEVLDKLEQHPRFEELKQFSVWDLINLSDEEASELQFGLASLDEVTFDKDVNGILDWLGQHKKVVIDIS